MNEHIVLKIENYVPNIYFVSNKVEPRKITQQSENILANMTETAKKLGLEFDAKNAYESLMQIAKESDDLYLDEYADLDPEDIEFNIAEIFEMMTNSSLLIEKEYKNVKMSTEARKEIDQNQSGDIFVSILESVYLRMIAKTLLAAADLGIGEIHLNDENKTPRLAEKMSKEMDRMGIEFVID